MAGPQNPFGPGSPGAPSTPTTYESNQLAQQGANVLSGQGTQNPFGPNAKKGPISGGVAGPLAVAEKAQQTSDLLMSKIDPSKESNDGTPFWSSGARSLIKVGGKALAVCQDFRWTVTYQATPIQTIDTAFPWDIDVGQVTIQATLSRIMDPIRGPEADAIFPIMSAAIHQPMVEMQVLDALGTCLFFARGMFTSVTGAVVLGQLSNVQAGFVGVAYQHYVSQEFQPYGLAGAAGDLLGSAQDVISDLTGGFV